VTRVGGKAMAREIELVRIEHRRSMRACQSARRYLSALERRLRHSRDTQDGEAYSLVYQVADAQRLVEQAVADVAGYRRILDGLTGARR
jgi:hypothetical protein